MGLVSAILALILFGADGMILPALVMIAAGLLSLRRFLEERGLAHERHDSINDSVDGRRHLSDAMAPFAAFRPGRPVPKTIAYLGQVRRWR